MRVTLSVELQESEQQCATRIKHFMEERHPNVEMSFVTNKSALAERIHEAMSKKKYEVVLAEIEDRLKRPALADDCLDTLCSVIFFSTQRIAEGHSSSLFIGVIARLPEEQREKIKTDLVCRAMSILSNPRRLDCSRMPLLPYAETLAMMVKAELLPIRSVLIATTQMIRLETTRTAGMTCLGKLVELAFDAVRTCDSSTIAALRNALTFAQQGDTFLYDVEYIMDAFGWSMSRSPLSLCRSGTHHKSPILAMAYSGAAGANARELVVTSSVDGCIGTWDGSGGLTENIVLSRHYASSLDLTNRGHTLLVGTVGRNSSTPPAVISYTNELDAKWSESAAVEPANALFITAVRSMRSSSSLRFCVGTHTGTSNPLQIYDRQMMINEFRDHTDILTALHVPTDNDNTIISGSRDSTVVMYDVRLRNGTNTYTVHNNTVTAIATCGDFLFTAGLDKRVIIQDFRMGGTVASREMDSAVLGISVSSTMQCAVSTLTGIHIISCASNPILPCNRVDSGPQAPRYNALAWNSAGTLLYAGGDHHQLDVYSRFEGDYDELRVMQ